MGADVYVNAIREISEKEVGLIKAYNTLIENNISISEDLWRSVEGILDEEIKYEEAIKYTSVRVETPIKGEGRVEYGDGMVIEVSDLPEGTVAIRVYMQA